MPSLSKQFTKEQIETALEYIIENKPDLKPSTQHNLLYKGLEFPPKEVVRWAAKLAKLPNWEAMTLSGGDNTNLPLKELGFIIKDKSGKTIQEELIEKYKILIKHGNGDEVYKWELIEKYKGRPRIDVEDFGAEVMGIEYKNLIYHNGIAVRNHIAKEKPEEYRRAFIKLFKTGIDLKIRIIDFKKDIENIYKSIGGTLQNHHDERTIASFLAFYNPDEYPLYKKSFYSKYCSALNIKEAGKNEKYVHYLELIEDFINSYIINDDDIIEIKNEFLSNDSYHDGNNLILAQDILYQTLDNQKMEFKDLISEINDVFIAEKESTRFNILFDSLNNKGSREWVWISDIQGVIGTETAHYELEFDQKKENKVLLSLHFEDEFNTEFITRIGEHLPQNLDWFPWFKSKSIRFTTSFDLNEENVVSKIINGLIYFEDQLGNKVREIIKGKLLKNVPKMQLINEPLNQILYGPPGTGKTYHTINKALAIIENKPEIELAKENRSNIKERFDDYIKEGQIIFTTFHQSMSYEDFVEGIKPVLEDDDEIDGKESSIQYKRKSGIFKTACAFAAYNAYQVFNTKNHKKNISYSFDNLYEAFIGHVKTLMNEGENPTYKSFSGKDTSIIYINKNDSIHAVSKNSSGIRKPAPLTKENLEKLYNKYHSISEIKSLSEVKETVGVSPRTTEFFAVFGGLKDFEKDFFNHLNKDDFQDLPSSLSDEEIVKKFESGVFNQAINSKDLNPNPVVLIIDEINRGNVSGIFGELITLIEDNKRAEEIEALSVTLPYSNSIFTVPSNLYLIGTMNTADRSVEALDSALRRRFNFVEMLPKSELLSPQNMLYRLWVKYGNVSWEDKGWQKKDAVLCEFLGISTFSNLLVEEKKALEKDFEDGKGPELFTDYVEVVNINLELILSKINKRLEKLLSRDHTIGHSFFINVCNNKDLYQVFYDKIIPLLQEYFFGDYGKIGLVLGKAFVNDVSKVDSEKDFFAPFEYEEKDMLLEKKVYRIEKFENDVDYSNFLTAVKSI